MCKRPVLSLFVFLRKLQVSLEFCSYVIKQVRTCSVYNLRNSGSVCLKLLFLSKYFYSVKSSEKGVPTRYVTIWGENCRKALKARRTRTDPGEAAFCKSSDGHCEGTPLKSRFFYSRNLHERHTKAYQPECALPP